eukprot:CAMPEP_0117449638 /NCGR_PEP_ID=MMETSP0759-20121206/8047_1 /TAXON_ID=63605 /ORGANISM="Percolomonas cosmopolitus, Strain WS" /LENGTH=617 /DNA_ID=CAMNT_0005242117 /DNA_START=290 /DNA_END=2140 /DNA_ORIENTATION=+
MGYNEATETWFDDGLINLCYNCVDVHVKQGKANQKAYIWESPVTGSESVSLTYGELLEKVQKLAWVMKTKGGVTKGDRVIIYMPMILEATVAILACSRLGATFSVVFGGFASKELAVRISDSEPKMILSATCGFEPNEKVVNYKSLLDDALRIANWTDKATCLIFRRDSVFEYHAKGKMPSYSMSEQETGIRTLDWEEEMEHAHLFKECIPVPSNFPLYLLYTSGTTSKPKGVVRSTGGHLVQLLQSMHDIFTTKGVFWAASDIGWVVGLSYSCIAPLLHGTTSIIFEGKPVQTPDEKIYWRLIEKHGVETFFSSPTAFRAIKQADYEGRGPREFDLSSLKEIFVAGERCDVDTWKWLQSHTGKPCLDNFWQSESGSPMLSMSIGLEQKEGDALRMILVEGSAGPPVSGYNVQVKRKDEDGTIHDVPAGQEGHLVIKKPLPPGMLIGLWKNPQRFQKAYFEEFPGYYDTGDAGYRDEEGNFFVSQRTDDIIQVAAHRLSTSSMESSLTLIPDIAEAAVVAVKDELKGVVPVGLVILSKNSTLTDEHVEKVATQQIRENVGPLASFKRCLVVKQIPKTRSGKVLRRSIRSILNGEEITEIPATIEDAAALDHVREVAQ